MAVAAVRPSRSVTPPPRIRQADISPPPSPGIPPEQQDVDDLTRCTICEHGGPDLQQLQKQSLTGCLSTAALRKAWGSFGQRVQTLGWLCGGFEKWSLHDEWFINTVALLDRAVVARSHHRSLQIDALAAALASLKMCEAEVACDRGIRDMVIRLGKDVPNDGLHKLWKQIVKIELTMLQELGFRVGLPTFTDFAGKFAMDICLTTTNLRWPGLRRMRPVKLEGGKHSLPQPALLVLMHFIIELGVMHLPEITYLHGSSPCRLALASLGLALESFGEAPQDGLEYWKAQRQQLLKADENLERLMDDLRQCWRNPPFGSMVIRKWSERNLDLPHPPALRHSGDAYSPFCASSPDARQSISTSSSPAISTLMYTGSSDKETLLSQESSAGFETPGSSSAERPREESVSGGSAACATERLMAEVKIDETKQRSLQPKHSLEESPARLPSPEEASVPLGEPAAGPSAEAPVSSEEVLQPAAPGADAVQLFRSMHAGGLDQPSCPPQPQYAKLDVGAKRDLLKRRLGDASQTAQPRPTHSLLEHGEHAGPPVDSAGPTLRPAAAGRSVADRRKWSPTFFNGHGPTRPVENASVPAITTITTPVSSSVNSRMGSSFSKTFATVKYNRVGDAAAFIKSTVSSSASENRSCNVEARPAQRRRLRRKCSLDENGEPCNPVSDSTSTKEKPSAGSGAPAVQTPACQPFAKPATKAVKRSATESEVSSERHAMCSDGTWQSGVTGPKRLRKLERSPLHSIESSTVSFSTSSTMPEDIQKGLNRPDYLMQGQRQLSNLFTSVPIPTC